MKLIYSFPSSSFSSLPPLINLLIVNTIGFIIAIVIINNQFRICLPKSELRILFHHQPSPSDKPYNINKSVSLKYDLYFYHSEPNKVLKILAKGLYFHLLFVPYCQSQTMILERSDNHEYYDVFQLQTACE